MKLTQFRIFNYKSIVDSGICQLADDMTILIGKNESGKTAVLEALRDFDREQYVICDNAYPLKATKNEEPTLEMVFQLYGEELDTIEQETGLTIKEDVRKYILKKGFCITKTYLGDYRLNNDYLNRLFGDLQPNETISELTPIQNMKERLDRLMPGNALPELIFDQGSDALEASLQQIKSAVKKQLLIMNDEKKGEEAVELIRAILKESTRQTKIQIKSNPKASFIESIVNHLPRFVFFSDFNDMLPFEISINDLKNNQSVLDFARIAELDLDELIETTDFQRRVNLLNRHSATISGDFLGYWEQDKTELVVLPENNKLLFGIKESEHGDFFKIDQRSRGFQWFLAFYLKLNSYKSQNIVLLIDEPGINLHPVAQKDILNILKTKSNENMQIVFSTHSLFLIDTDRLDRVRPIIKNKEKGSIIESAAHGDMDQETLFPITAALAAKQPVNFPAPANQAEIPLEQPNLEEATIPSYDPEPAPQPDPETEAESIFEAAAETEEVAVASEPSTKDSTDELNLESVFEAEPPPKEKPKKSGFFSWFK